MSKSCGGCQYFVKWKNDMNSSGFCEIKDSRTNTDGGHRCTQHKRMPYNRKIEVSTETYNILMKK